MVAANISRGVLRAVLSPFQWVTLCELEDPYFDPAYVFHHISAHLEADVINGANATVEIHESENGTNWCRSTGGRCGVLVPGGMMDIRGVHVLRWVRIVLYSTGSGIVRATRFVPESQVLPGYIHSPPEVEAAGDPTVTVENQGPVDPQKPCNFEYQFEARLDWDAVEWCWEVNPTAGRALIVNGGGWWENGEWCIWLYPGLDLYVRDMNAGEVVYFNNLAGTYLSLNYDAFPNCLSAPVPPEITTGTYTVNNSFYVWYSQRNDCAPEAEGVTRRITITNTGTCIIAVNGTVLQPGGVYTLNDYLYAGYVTGDMSAWLGGTPVTV